MIRNNRHKYSVSAMCIVLQMSRSTYYYEAKIRDDQDQELKVIVSDLTYVRVRQRWHYICVFVDLYNREIIGHSAGPHKTAELV